MSVRTFIEGWPVYRQLTGTDPLGRGAAAKSGRTARLDPRTRSADKVVKSVCPYCAVGSAPKGRPACSSPPATPGSTRCCTGGRTAPTGSP